MNRRKMKLRIKSEMADYLDNYPHSDFASWLKRQTLWTAKTGHKATEAANARYHSVLRELIQEWI